MSSRTLEDPSLDFEPQHDGYASRVRSSFDKQGFMATLGARLLRVEPGWVDVALPFSPQLTQQHGFMHAGAVAAVVDTACGLAALSLMPEDAAVLTVEFKINLLAPARGDAFIARGVVKKAGRTLMVTTGDVFDNDHRVTAALTATIMVIQNRGLTG
ncbi:MAG: PaaI family thioesterase [Myxococcota bacterium]